jgi:hypothetical protein
MLCVGVYLGPAASFEVASRVSRGVCNGTIYVDIEILLPLYFALLLVLVWGFSVLLSMLLPSTNTSPDLDF